jgi:2,3-bisphosphoglycerate-independent phosphoglycerate mutase
MSLPEITDEIIKHLESDGQRAVIANLANLDQVGHLGRLDLATQAARVVDAAFTRIADAAQKNGWTLMVTADHGNAELVEDEAGGPFGSHTQAPVPFLIQAAAGQTTHWNAERGSLAQVASTYLKALGLEPPQWMEPPLAIIK